MSGALGTHTLAQVGFIVKDIEEAKKKWAAFLGMEVPPTQPVGKYEITQTVYKNEPSPLADCKLAFFNCGPGNMQIELIEPNEASSTWHDYLAEHGEGMHHIAFQVQNSEECVKNAEECGLQLVQRGFYGDKSGQYHYLDAPEFGCVIELLENFPKN